MQKRMVHASAPSPPGRWLNVDVLADVELTSEEAAHPVEAALTSGRTPRGGARPNPARRASDSCFTGRKVSGASGSGSTRPTTSARRSSRCAGPPTAGRRFARSCANSTPSARLARPRGRGLERRPRRCHRARADDHSGSARAGVRLSGGVAPRLKQPPKTPQPRVSILSSISPLFFFRSILPPPDHFRVQGPRREFPNRLCLGPATQRGG